ncbi:sensor histidine kinase [Alteraurantiacibacter palmitatis]|uniref:histidine kinase n=1 Tax=Alteraurantiacibacter palmitatis TaxID=2054628 RepID=A0ABV7E8G1_9SPHN
MAPPAKPLAANQARISDAASSGAVAGSGAGAGAVPVLLPGQIETVAELRDLYRAAEARAARLRLLSETGRDLAQAGVDAGEEAFQAALDTCARRLAHFLGCGGGQISLALPDGEETAAIPVLAPGLGGVALAWLVIPGFTSPDTIRDAEDREAVQMLLQLFGAAIDRSRREAERSQLLEQLQERERRLEYLVGRIFFAQEEERRRVSHELHDGVAQKATALFRMLEGDPAAPGRLAGIARELVSELREVIGGLRPTILDDLGLPAALRALAAGLKSEGFAVEQDIAEGAPRWPPNLETAFFRVAQEAISNIRKHAGGPCRVKVALMAGEQDAEWRLLVRDHGTGGQGGEAGATGRNPADPSAAPGEHIGIEVMRERMAAIGGSLSWRFLPGGGVEVLATLPRHRLSILPEPHVPQENASGESA